MSGFEVAINGRFWVATEGASPYAQAAYLVIAFWQQTDLSPM